MNNMWRGNGSHEFCLLEPTGLPRQPLHFDGAATGPISTQQKAGFQVNNN